MAKHTPKPRNFNINIKVDPKTPQEITETLASVSDAVALTADRCALKRQLIATATARETDQIIAEIKAIGNFAAGEVGDINTAIRYSQFGSSSTATAQYIKEEVLEGVNLQSILDDVMGN
jgi:hypothetical protein